MRKKTRVAIITARDPGDRKVWSGIPNFITHALQQEFDEVVTLGPVQITNLKMKIAGAINFRLSNGITLLTRALFNKRHNHDDSMVVSIINAEYFDTQLKNKGPFDLIITVASPMAIARLKTTIPIFNVGDGTFKLLNGYYPFISNLLQFSQYETYAVERRALHNAVYNIYCSEWAATSAIKDYAVPAEKVKVIAFGANIETEPARQEVLRQDFSYKLLFLGVDWARKGGAIAFECLTELVNRGLNVTLTVCGCVPPTEFQHQNMDVIPFLDKNDPAQYRRFVTLMKESDFLLLPTRAECYGVVFCEASAYGIPSITTDTGGVGGAVEDGVNGFKLPFDAPGKDYAALIARLYSDKDAYLRLSISARNKYENELNWGTWSRRVKDLFLSL